MALCARMGLWTEWRLRNCGRDPACSFGDGAAMTSELIHEIVRYRQLLVELEYLDGLTLKSKGHDFVITGRVTYGNFLCALRFLAKQ